MQQLWPAWLGRGRRQCWGHSHSWWRGVWRWKWRHWECLSCDPSVSATRWSTQFCICQHFHTSWPPACTCKSSLKPQRYTRNCATIYTLYSPPDCTTARYFRVGRCLMRHRSPHERGSPEEKESSSLFFSLLPSLPIFLPSSLPPCYLHNLTPSLLTIKGTTFLLKLPVGVGWSGGRLQNAMVRAALAAVNYERKYNFSLEILQWDSGTILLLPSSMTAGSSAKEPSAAM